MNSNDKFNEEIDHKTELKAAEKYNPILRQNKTRTDFQYFVEQYTADISALLIEKNQSYGNSAIDPVRVFSNADSLEQIKVRIDDKLSRIKRGNNAFNEDTIKDLIGYLILLEYKTK
jgi:ubiquinone biosynthesis protein Coq4